MKRVPVRERYFFDCYGCKDCSDKTLIDLFVSIVDFSGMRLIERPQAVRVEDGFSIQGIWEASTLAIHGWDDPAFVTVDVYSCKPLDVVGIVNLIIDKLSPKQIKMGSVSPSGMTKIYRRKDNGKQV